MAADNSSTALALALYAGLVAPLALTAWRPKIAAALGVAYGAIILWTSAWHGGFVGHADLSPYDISDIRAENPGGECGQVVAVLEQGRVILDRRQKSRVIVDPRLWEQIPVAARDLAVSCLETENDGEAVEVVNRPS